MNDKITKQLHEWLSTDDHSDVQHIREGAELLLILNRNRAIYNHIINNPLRHVSKLEYELKKFLPIKLANMTLSDVKKMDAELIPDVKAAIDKEKPSADGNEESSAHDGKRTDHDGLPESIKSLYTTNAERWKKIKELYNLLQTIEQPCDRYEHLAIMKELWYDYKKDMCRYDDYVADDDDSDDDEHVETDTQDDVNTSVEPAQFTSARSYISKNRKRLASLAEAAKSDNATQTDLQRYQDAYTNMSRRISLLVNNSMPIGDSLRAELTSLGFTIPKY